MPSRQDVRETYDRIATHFAETRAHPWEEVVDFLDERTGSLGIDIGCGNGRHAAILAKRTTQVLALDVSKACLEEASIRLSNGDDITLIQGDAWKLPVLSDTVDVAIYVATIHHLPYQRTRQASLDELARVLTQGGCALVSAWSVSHESFDAEDAFDTTVNWTLPNGDIVPRYYHIYDLPSFRRDLKRSRLDPVQVFESRGNCYGIVKK